MPRAGGLNESHRRRLLASAQYADKLLGEIEDILKSSESKSPFLKYRPDISLPQARLIRNYASRFRDHLRRALEAAGIERPGPQFSALHSVRVTLSFLRIAVQEMAPHYLRGYGALGEDTEAELRGVCAELEGVIAGLERNLALGEAADLQARLERLGHTAREAELLRLLDRIVQEDNMAEFRAALVNLTEKLESPSFEVAVFGRVSSGKSSLLNHILEAEVLPVGVNPITAVPTRLVYGPQPKLTVTFADRQVREYPIGELETYASEELNPGNEMGVIRLVAALPSPRLSDGLVFVDTPGLGALATAGAAETLFYLPQCDLGILLVSAANPINDEDLNTIQALVQAGIPVMALLSKADLLSARDREKALKYTKREIQGNLGLEIEVHPVSTLGQEQELLEAWFRGQLQPVLARHREQVQNSIRRKAGAVAESVAAALRLKLGGGAAGAGAGPAAAVEEVEHRLRTAAGEIETTRRDCLTAVDGFRRLPALALDRMADQVLKIWSQKTRPQGDAGELFAGVASGLAAEGGSGIAARLTALAQSLQAALAAAGEILPDVKAMQEEPWERLVREMPRFEAAFEPLSLSRPWLHGWRPWSRAWILRRLRRHWGDAVWTAFENYARSLERWVRQTLGDIQRQFDAQADACRAQLARLAAASSLTPEQRTQLERHLAELARYLPQQPAGAATDFRAGDQPLPL